jgi:AraC-like DNA-binding protein
MMRAMELLAKPRASVSATAYAVGFQSASAFATAFTERCGETPSEYRARIREA